MDNKKKKQLKNFKKIVSYYLQEVSSDPLLQENLKQQIH